MGMGFAPTWLRQVSPPPVHMTTLTIDVAAVEELTLGQKGRHTVMLVLGLGLECLV